MRLVCGQYVPAEEDFTFPDQNIVITAQLLFEPEDYEELHSRGVLCKYKSFDAWKRVFTAHLPSLNGDCLTFSLIVGHDKGMRYSDGFKKNNTSIPEVLPKIYFIDSLRHLQAIEDDILMFQDDEMLQRLKDCQCMFDSRHECRRCFQCIGLITQKNAGALNVLEAMRPDGI